MIKKFSCKGFKNIVCKDLDFTKINILIGSNNAGKSNFIRAISFAANIVSNPKTEKTGFLSELKRNGWDAAADKHSADKKFKLMWNFELADNKPVNYTLQAQVGNNRADNYIVEESLDSTELKEGREAPYNYFSCHKDILGKGQFSTAGMRKTKNNRIRTNVNQYESVLLQMDNLFFESKELFSTLFVRDEIRKVLKSMETYFNSFFAYSCTAFDLNAIRDLQDKQAEGDFLKKDGSNFVNVFSVAKSSDEGFHKRYIESLHRLSNQCEDVIIKEGNGKIWMEVQMDGIWYPLSEVSDGTVHLLLLLLLLNLPGKNSITNLEGNRHEISMLAIDEPEMNLHPAWQKLLANEIMNGQSFTQCFISTHSPDFLDEFTEGFLSGKVNVFVFDKSSRIPIRKLDRGELMTELQEWTLGDLYRVGDAMIGGWPQ